MDDGESIVQRAEILELTNAHVHARTNFFGGHLTGSQSSQSAFGIQIRNFLPCKD
jgi:hypothetical protein